MIFRRKLYDDLLAWKREYNGSTALLIKGARRVGKSTLAEEFAKNEYASYILIDFTKCSEEILKLFNDVSDLDRIFLKLQLEYGVELKNRDSVIIFDEVQFCPKARQAIKHLVKDGRYDYIETGSLISIRKNIQGILIPSEEIEITMYPMDYEEFRWVINDTATIPLIKQCFLNKTSLGDATNRKLLRDFRLYMLVGGMPQAVECLIETNNLEKVDKVKRAIITLYEKDFNRIDPTGNASKMFHRIPAQLTSNSNRYMSWRATGGVPQS
ncbi:MAG: AAA family ATPase, partial [Muribaculaceae bacterium]|nr:AAA family ATPase [Muribaculaceae bacterium]